MINSPAALRPNPFLHLMRKRGKQANLKWKSKARRNMKRPLAGSINILARQSISCVVSYRMGTSRLLANDLHYFANDPTCVDLSLAFVSSRSAKPNEQPLDYRSTSLSILASKAHTTNRFSSRRAARRGVSAMCGKKTILLYLRSLFFLLASYSNKFPSLRSPYEGSVVILVSSSSRSDLFSCLRQPTLRDSRGWSGSCEANEGFQ